MIETLENRRMFSLTDVAVWNMEEGWVTNEAGLTFSDQRVENIESLDPNDSVDLSLTSLENIDKFRDILIWVRVITDDQPNSNLEGFMLGGNLNDWGDGIQADEVQEEAMLCGWKDVGGDAIGGRGPYAVQNFGDDDWFIHEVVVKAHIPEVWIPTPSSTIVEGDDFGNVAQVQRDDLFWTERSLTVRIEVEEFHNDPNHPSIDDIGEVLLDGSSDGYLDVVIAEDEQAEGFDLDGALDTQVDDKEAFKLKIIEPVDPLYIISPIKPGEVVFYIEQNNT